MATSIADFYVPMRVWLDDQDSSAYLFEDTHLANAVKSVVRGGFISGVSVSGDSLEPTVPDGALWGMIFLNAVRALMTPGADGGGFSTRPFRHSDRGNRTALAQITERLYELEQQLEGGVIQTYQDLASYLSATTGRSEYWQLVEVTQMNPVNRVNISMDGADILS